MCYPVLVRWALWKGSTDFLGIVLAEKTFDQYNHTGHDLLAKAARHSTQAGIQHETRLRKLQPPTVFPWNLIQKTWLEGESSRGVSWSSAVSWKCIWKIFFWGNPSWNNHGINVSYVKIQLFLPWLLYPLQWSLQEWSYFCLTQTKYLLPIPRPHLFISDYHISLFNHETILGIHG